MKKQIALPAFISSLRIAALPLFFYLYNLGNITSCLILLAFCATTDYFDGYLARKLKATSRFGAYYDAATDFILMIGIFSIFYSSGYYPIWLLLLIAASFLQFLATSQYTKKLYDPVGRYLGSALYIGAVLTLLWPAQAIFAFVQYAFAGFFLVSLASRTISLTRKQKAALN
ncbi:MAG: CDP-alcohol phosphatidyltransferase family protein [Candidatus Bathyarchaeota archaeon]|nr:CDP-alcohol phosphatidyltransferase family protein [Candidatus Bathyarchaeota archaeon]